MELGLERAQVLGVFFKFLGIFKERSNCYYYLFWGLKAGSINDNILHFFFAFFLYCGIINLVGETNFPYQVLKDFGFIVSAEMLQGDLKMGFYLGLLQDPFSSSTIFKTKVRGRLFTVLELTRGRFTIPYAYPNSNPTSNVSGLASVLIFTPSFARMV